MKNSFHQKDLNILLELIPNPIDLCTKNSAIVKYGINLAKIEVNYANRSRLLSWIVTFRWLHTLVPDNFEMKPASL